MGTIVAIVGRPNVGKSTLFNRMIGFRKSIVEDEPGVTRDRNYGEALWDGKFFTVIDTGGFEPSSDKKMEVQIREQIQYAMEEADVILFLLDGKEGLAPSDREIEHLLRAQGKPVIHCVNKVDGSGHEERVFDFYQLGVDPIYSVSAAHGYGIGELLDEVVKLLPESESEKEHEKRIRVAVVGRPNVGKSSWINRILGQKRLIVDDQPGTTRDAVDVPFEIGGRNYLLIDTAGIRRKKKISLRLEKFSIGEALKSIDRCDVALLLLDPLEKVTEQDARIGGFIQEKGKACVIAVNKWDLMQKDSTTANRYTEEIHEGLKHLSYAPIVFVSALTGLRVKNTLDLIDRVAQEHQKRVPTGRLNAFLQKTVEQLHPPIHRGKRARIYFMTQSSIKPPTFVAFVSNPQAIHFSYERYLINQLREQYGFEGTPIRIHFRPRRGRA
jgi:GTP-binding protein